MAERRGGWGVWFVVGLVLLSPVIAFVAFWAYVFWIGGFGDHAQEDSRPQPLEMEVTLLGADDVDATADDRYVVTFSEPDVEQMELLDAANPAGPGLAIIHSWIDLSREADTFRRCLVAPAVVSRRGREVGRIPAGTCFVEDGHLTRVSVEVDE